MVDRFPCLLCLMLIEDQPKLLMFWMKATKYRMQCVREITISQVMLLESIPPLHLNVGKQTLTNCALVSRECQIFYLENVSQSMCILQPNATKQISITPYQCIGTITTYHLPNLYMLFNGLCWSWNIYVYFITNANHCITYLALTSCFLCLRQAGLTS